MTPQNVSQTACFLFFESKDTPKLTSEECWDHIDCHTRIKATGTAVTVEPKQPVCKLHNAHMALFVVLLVLLLV